MVAWGDVEEERRRILRFHNWSLVLTGYGERKKGLGKETLEARIGRNKEGGGVYMLEVLLHHLRGFVPEDVV